MVLRRGLVRGPGFGRISEGCETAESEEDAQVMELREEEIMARLGFDSPY